MCKLLEEALLKITCQIVLEAKRLPKDKQKEDALARSSV